jgi:uncharacterized protein YndB with AHSA1/START domain
MTTHSVTYNTFRIERMYPVQPASVFAAFTASDAKAHWMSGDNDPDAEVTNDAELDFRVGGHERFEFTEEDGRKMTYDARYYDIVPDRRIVYSYEMYADEARISVSVATIEFLVGSAGTSLTWTEQGVYLDGHDQPELREGGTSWMLDNLSEYLAPRSADTATSVGRG